MLNWTCWTVKSGLELIEIQAMNGHKPLFDDLSEFTFADHVRPIVILAMTTGMRRGEIFQLQWADINFEKGEVTLRADTTKSKKPRTFYLATFPLRLP